MYTQQKSLQCWLLFVGKATERCQKSEDIQKESEVKMRNK